MTKKKTKIKLTANIEICDLQKCAKCESEIDIFRHKKDRAFSMFEFFILFLLYLKSQPHYLLIVRN